MSIKYYMLTSVNARSKMMDKNRGFSLKFEIIIDKSIRILLFHNRAIWILKRLRKYNPFNESSYSVSGNLFNIIN